MRVAFVGIKREFQKIKQEIGIDIPTFVRYHLELPFYYSRKNGWNCYVTTVDSGFRSGDPVDLYSIDRSSEDDDDPDERDYGYEFFAANRSMNWYDYEYFTHTHGVHIVHEDWLKDKGHPAAGISVVVHWRSWQEWAWEARPNAVHLLQTCDHTYSPEWKNAVMTAVAQGKLAKIICFETWHVRKVQQELGLPWNSFVTNVHLGVDTGVYRPEKKDPFKLLWASDPGRGFERCLEVFRNLFAIDRRYTLHVTYPDYAKPGSFPIHPNIRVYHGLRNGEQLWDLFNTSTFVPYTSTFMEPSSRVHRQAQAAGCCVVYPTNMGSPSELIIDGRTGLVVPYDPVVWAERIHAANISGEAQMIGRCARTFALTEDWDIQAQRFEKVCRELLLESKR